MPDVAHPSTARARARERASSVVEYIGLGALSTMLVSGIAGAIDSTAGNRVAASLIHRLIEAISAGG